MSNTEDQVLNKLLDELGVSEDEREDFLRNVEAAAQALTSSPQEELKWRLNAQLRGDDPGRPVNWQGLV